MHPKKLNIASCDNHVLYNGAFINTSRCLFLKMPNILKLYWIHTCSFLGFLTGWLCFPLHVAKLMPISVPTGFLHNHLRVLTAGLKTFEIPPDYRGNYSSLNPHTTIHVLPEESCSMCQCVLWQFFSFCFIKDVVLPDKPKLKFMNKVPNLKKAKKEMKKLRDIQGPARAANTFTTGKYAIVVRSYRTIYCTLVLIQ